MLLILKKTDSKSKVFYVTVMIIIQSMVVSLNKKIPGLMPGTSLWYWFVASTLFAILYRHSRCR